MSCDFIYKNLENEVSSVELQAVATGAWRAQVVVEVKEGPFKESRKNLWMIGRFTVLTMT